MHMRLRAQFAIGCALVLWSTAPANAQDAARVEGERIIEQYLKAAGGSHRISRIHTLSLQGAITGADGGNAGAYTLDVKLPNRYYQELVIGDNRFIEAYNGKSAWRQDGSGSPATMISPESGEMQARAQIANTHLADLKKNKVQVASVGHATVEGKDALQVELTSPAGVKQELFFDAQTHLLVEESSSVGGVAEQAFYSDYRPEGGVQIPRKVALHRGSETYMIAINTAAVNGRIGERVFDLPLSAQVKLPDLKALFKELDDNQKAIDKLSRSYAGTKTEEETEYDSHGKVKEHHVTESTFTYLYGDEVSTAVKKDGKPLSPAEQKKEEEATRKRIAEIKKEQAKKDAEAAKPKTEDKSKSDDSEVGIEMFLRTCQFVNPRRERYRGRSVLVFDFEANPEYKAHGLAEHIIQKLAGTIWVDEEAKDVARLEAYFAKDARILGGLLASVHKGTAFIFEQEFVNNEVWLPTYEEMHLGVRALLLIGFNMSEVTRYSDYKKLPAETPSASSSAKPN